MVQLYEDIDLGQSVWWLFGREAGLSTSDDGRTDHFTAGTSETTTPVPTSSTSSWFGAAADLVRVATTLVAAAWSTGDKSNKDKKIRRWRSKPPGGNVRLGASYPAGFPCSRRGFRGELWVREKKRSPAAHYACFSGGSWADWNGEMMPWVAQPMRHVWAESSRSPSL